MYSIKTEFGTAICRGCLSTDRRLLPLTNNKSFFNLLTDKQKQEVRALMDLELLMCWECTAALKRMQLFQAQAQKAHMVLEQHFNNPLSISNHGQVKASIKSLSSLTTFHTQYYDARFIEIERIKKPPERINPTIGPVITPIKIENVLTVKSDDEMNEDDSSNEIEDTDHLEVNADFSLEQETVMDEVEQPWKKYFSVLKNMQQRKEIANVAVRNTKIKVKNLENEEFYKTRNNTSETIKRPPSARIKKLVRSKMNVNEIKKVTGKKKTSKRAASPIQSSQGLRRSKRRSGIVEVGERENSKEFYVEIGDDIGKNNVELIKEYNESDSDIGGRDDVDLINLNKNCENELKANKIVLIEKENANSTGNGGRDDDHIDSMICESLEAASSKISEQELIEKENANNTGNGGSDDDHTDSMNCESLEAASSKISEQANKEDENDNKVQWVDFGKTLVEYKSGELDTYFTKLELSEEETEVALQREPKYITKELPWNCDYCGLCFQVQRTMINHKRDVHKQLRKMLNQINPNIYYRDSVFRCNQCPAVLRETHTAAHMKYVHRFKYNCKHCEMEFWNKEECKPHMAANHSQFECDICSEIRSSLKLLQKHKAHDHKVRQPKSNNNPLQCEECGKKVSSSWYLIAHQEMKHPREGTDPRFHCASCNFTLRSERHYLWHLKNSKAHNPDVKKLPRCPCPACGKVCKSKYEMKRHYDRFHSDKTDFPCKICGKYLSRKSGLNYHINHVHLKVQPPKDKLCTICGQGFSSNRTLKYHIRTHTGERPYKCTLCPAAFAQPWPLKKHQATQHRHRTTQSNTKDTTEQIHEVKSQKLDQIIESRSQDEIKSQSLAEVIDESTSPDDVIVESTNQDEVIARAHLDDSVITN